MADSFGLAFYKAEEATQARLPYEGAVLITVADPDKPGVVDVAKRFGEMGFRIYATGGTHQLLADNGVDSEQINRMHEGRPNIVDAIKNGEIHLVVNTPVGRLSQHDDSYIRKAAIKYKIPYITTTAAALAAARGIGARREGQNTVKSLQEYHRDIG